MLTLPLGLQEIDPSLRDEVQGFLKALVRARRFGYLSGTGLSAAATTAVDVDRAVQVEWARDHVDVLFDQPVSGLGRSDLELVRRGLLHILSLHGDDSAEDQAAALTAPLAATPPAAESTAFPRASGHEVTDFLQPFHIHLWFESPVQESVLQSIADALTVFEQLAKGLRPAPGDVFADMGPSSLSLLEPEHVQIWIDGLYADEADWRSRFERMLGRLDLRCPIRELVYEGE